jgi:hypothetical protein
LIITRKTLRQASVTLDLHYSVATAVVSALIFVHALILGAVAR